MNPKILILVSLLFSSTVNFSQNMNEELPQEIQTHLLSIKKNITKQLDSCRFENESLSIGALSRFFSDGEGIKNKERELALAKLNLEWNMVFDDYMIDRTIQLLNNEYRKEEFDSLVNTELAIINKNRQWERETMFELKIDESRIFRHAMDSLNRHRNMETHPNRYNFEEALYYLGIDTTAYFRLAVDSIIRAAKQENIDNYLNRFHFDIEGLIQSCGFIGDSRLKEPMFSLLNKYKKRLDFLKKEIELLENKEETEEVREILDSYRDERIEKERIINALYISSVQMRVEPYYTHFFEKWGCPTDDYCIVYFYYHPIDLFRNQEIFSITANSLLSTDKVNITGDGDYRLAYEDAYKDIVQYIENDSLWKIINNHGFNLKKDRFKIYDWMKKNYGKYQIKRIW